jgi:acyl-CoA thioester hydrolase
MSRDKRLQDRSIYPHWCSDTVRFSDQDAAGHVNNVALCAYLETARLTFMRDMGMFAPKEDGVRGISAGMTVSFLAESHWPGKVDASSRSAPARSRSARPPSSTGNASLPPR